MPNLFILYIYFAWFFSKFNVWPFSLAIQLPSERLLIKKSNATLAIFMTIFLTIKIKLKENEVVIYVYLELSKNGGLSITRSINLENEEKIESKCDKTQNVWSFLWTTATYCFFYKMYLWHALIVTTRKICEQQMINSASFSPNTEIR